MTVYCQDCLKKMFKISQALISIHLYSSFIFSFHELTRRNCESKYIMLISYLLHQWTFVFIYRYRSTDGKEIFGHF